MESFGQVPDVDFTICLVMQLWLNRTFTLRSQVQGSIYNTRLPFNKTANELNLYTNTGTTHLDLTNSFNGKKLFYGRQKIVMTILQKHYSSTLTQNSNPVNSGRNNFQFLSDDRVIHKLMYSPNFYDFDSEVYHRVMLQEKLDGSYVLE